MGEEGGEKKARKGRGKELMRNYKTGKKNQCVGLLRS